MKILLEKKRPKEIETEVLILPVYEEAKGLEVLESDVLQREAKALIRSGQFRASVGDTYLIRCLGHIKPQAVLLVGLGPKRDATKETFRRAGGGAGHFLKKLSLSDCAFYWDGTEEPEAFVEGLLLSSYTFTEYKRPETKGPDKLIVLSREIKTIERKLSGLQGLAEGVSFSRDLINRPSNELGPEELAEVAMGLKGRKIKVSVYDEKKIQSFGMHAFLAVSKGSHRPPRLIVVEYNGGGRTSVVLIGKSITFDSGGLSLKPSDGMEKMKYDMSGGAVVLGTIKVAKEMEVPAKIIGILPATDNMPGGGATRPGDIIKTVTGKTVEILNTDAEGRLTLADAIGFARRFKPGVIIDIATLTGACVIALGNEAAALMCNRDTLKDELLKASSETGERLWPMPLFDDYKEYLKSDVADLKNIGGRAGGLVTAGYFLKEFAEDVPWAHIDIASVAWSDKDRFYYTKGATAFGLRTLVEFLKSRKGE